MTTGHDITRPQVTAVTDKAGDVEVVWHDSRSAFVRTPQNGPGVTINGVEYSIGAPARHDGRDWRYRDAYPNRHHMYRPGFGGYATSAALRQLPALVARVMAAAVATDPDAPARAQECANRERAARVIAYREECAARADLVERIAQAVTDHVPLAVDYADARRASDRRGGDPVPTFGATVYARRGADGTDYVIVPDGYPEPPARRGADGYDVRAEVMR